MTRDRQQGRCIQSHTSKVGHARYHVRAAKLVCKLASGYSGGENITVADGLQCCRLHTSG